MKKIKGSFLILIFSLFISQNIHAQSPQWHSDKKIAVVFGLTQPVALSGFNLEVNYIYRRFVFDYSHGMSLDFQGNLLPDYLRNQGVEVYMPFSTGFGIGYRLTEWLNLRVESKWHSFEFYYKGEPQTAFNRVAADPNNYSVGLGVYGFFQPFKKKGNVLKGVTVAPSIRFWPTVDTRFDNNRFHYQNRNTGSNEQLKTLASGIKFSPLIINASIGYTFNLKKT
ncbi:hypothetical protein [Sphingobacterium haloxyli]|uniref:Outer membrane protein beta-barrel domain-containing protein n=1 Tax=Sphingobacterium haloxyli TaxID=2100533 RepID=A0A2S9J2X3_9SPHI|nr:hypothetical protein [Sphingobacterium haloxyli]PRD47094.1 hypothetical protein C5745_11785 [Sphingobacterium haloxyli]